MVIYYLWLLELLIDSLNEVSIQRSYMRISIIFHHGDLPNMPIFL